MSTNMIVSGRRSARVVSSTGSAEGGGSSGAVRAQSGHGTAEPLALADRQPELAQVVVGQLGKLIRGDPLGAKRIEALRQPDRAEPSLHPILLEAATLPGEGALVHNMALP